MNLATPTIHLNGTSSTALIDQNHAAIDALQTAFCKLQEAEPHGRDYPGRLGATNYQKARDQHIARLQRVQSVVEELRTIVDSIDTQVLNHQR